MTVNPLGHAILIYGWQDKVSLGLELIAGIAHDQAGTDRIHHLQIVEPIAERTAVSCRNPQMLQRSFDACRLRDIRRVYLHIFEQRRIDETCKPRPGQQLMEQASRVRRLRQELDLADLHSRQ